MKLRLVEDAHEEVIGTAAYYEAQRPGLGRDFLDEVRRALLAIEEHPERYAQLETTELPIRRFLLRRFPHYVAYEIVEAEVIVWALAHGSREPNYWISRRS